MNRINELKQGFITKTRAEYPIEYDFNDTSFINSDKIPLLFNQIREINRWDNMNSIKSGTVDYLLSYLDGVSGIIHINGEEKSTYFNKEKFIHSYKLYSELEKTISKENFWKFFQEFYNITLLDINEKSSDTVRMISIPLIDKGYKTGQVYILGSPLLILDPEKVSIVSVIAEFCGQRINQIIEKEEMKKSIYLDNLTELYNRKYFFEYAEQFLTYSKRYDQPLTFLMADIDHFKKINDQYGHQTGDFILKEIASLLKSCFRNADVIARYGGEEFIIILPNTNVKQASHVAERFRNKVSGKIFQYQNKKMKITVSAGISLLNCNDTIDTLIERADHYLYRAKNSGRNQIVFETLLSHTSPNELKV